MANWIPVAPLDIFLPNTYQQIEVNLLSVLVMCVENKFYAIEDLCTHDDVPLVGGELCGTEIICPFHGAKFCVKTGKVTEGPAYDDIRTFPVRINNNIVEVEFP